MEHGRPIHDRMQEIGQAVDERVPVGYGFIVLVFKFDAPPRTEPILYVSNAKREGVLTSMQEFITHNQDPEQWARDTPVT